MINFDYSQEKNPNLPNILFIHGFGSTKAFVNKFKKLPHNFNIISLSLPQNQTENFGHKASIASFSKWVQLFIKQNNLTNIYVLGHSLGGAIISYLHNLQEIKKFILCAPLHPYATFDDASMHSWLLPQNQKDAETSLEALAYNQEVWNGHQNFIAKTNLQLMTKNYDFFKDMVEQEILNSQYLNSQIFDNYQKIKDKAYLIGCKNDRYIQYQSLQKLIKKIPIDFTTIEDCGHVPLFEKPQQIKQIIEKIIN